MTNSLKLIFLALLFTFFATYENAGIKASASSDEAISGVPAVSLDKIKLGVDKGIKLEKKEEKPKKLFQEEKNNTKKYIAAFLSLIVILKVMFSIKKQKRI